MFSSKSIFRFSLRFLISLLAAHFIVVQGATESIAKLVTKGYYYLSVAYSFIIALILVELIYYVTKKLNEKHKNALLANKRITEQFLIGFLAVSLIAFLLAMILYWINGENIFSSVYFTKLYALILLFIFTINVVYLLYYYKNAIKPKYYLANPISSDRLDVDSTLPAIVYYDNKICFAIDFKGIKTVWPLTVGQSIKKLDDKFYFQINRQSIVHRSAIHSIKPFNIKHVKIEPVVYCPIELITSRRMSVQFKMWLATNH